VRLLVHRHQLGGGHVGVALCGAQTGVPEQLLDRAQVCSPLQQVGGKGMAQRVRTDAVTPARRGDIAPDESVDAPRRQTPASIVDEQRRCGQSGEPGQNMVPDRL